MEALVDLELAIIGAVPLGTHSVCVALSDGSYVLLSLEHLVTLRRLQATVNIVLEKEAGHAVYAAGDH